MAVVKTSRKEMNFMRTEYRRAATLDVIALFVRRLGGGHIAQSHDFVPGRFSNLLAILDLPHCAPKANTCCDAAEGEHAEQVRHQSHIAPIADIIRDRAAGPFISDPR